MDRDETIFVADTANHRLQAVHAQRPSRVFRLQSGVSNPKHAVMFHGKLVVASHGRPNMLTVFEETDIMLMLMLMRFIVPHLSYDILQHCTFI